MLQGLTTTRHAQRPCLEAGLARDQAEVYEAQRLRYKVFAEEMGARFDSAAAGIDSDLFDPHCEHLIVRDTASGQVIGTCRLLGPAAARRLGSSYAAEEFDLTRLQHLRGQTLEIGRSCVHMNYRSGATLALLWAGILRYAQLHGHQYLIGSASVGMADGGQNAAAIYHRLQAGSLSPVEYRVFPRCELPLDAYKHTDETIKLPTLIKGYLKIGAWVCSTPAWDPDFNTADLLMMLPMARINARYAQHFLRRAA